MAKKTVKPSKKKRTGKKDTLQTNGFFKQKPVMIALISVLLITFFTFFPALDNEFVNWDDDVNLTNNPNLEQFDAASLKGIFTDHIIGNYNPLPILTFAIERHVFQAVDPFLYHLDNVLLHLLVVFFVFRIGMEMGLKLPAVILLALLFGIHPMRVESVAWVTERKDVLFGAFFMAGIFTYLQYLKTALKEKKWLYFTGLLFFIGLFAKIQMVTFPLALLVIDYFFERKISIQSILEKVPFFLLSLVFGLLGIYFLAQNDSIMDTSIVPYGLPERLFIASYSFVVYLIKAVFPWEMSPLYPYPSSLSWPFYVAPAGVLGLGLLTFLAHRRGARSVVFGMGFFFFNIVFLLQIVGAGQGFLADRFTYIAYFGLFFMAAYYLQELLSRKENLKIPVFGVTALLLFGYASSTYRQCDIWQDSYALWTHTLKYYDRTALPYRNRGHYIREQGNPEAALKDYDIAVSLTPNDADLRNSRGKTYFDLGRYNEAIGEYEAAIENNAWKAEYYANKGAAYGAQGDFQRALKELNMAIKLDVKFSSAYLNRALVFYRARNFASALEDLNTYLTQEPNNAAIYYERALCHRQLGDENAALADLTTAIGLDPTKGVFYLERSKVNNKLGNKMMAGEDANTAQRLGAPVPPEMLQKFNR